jgi:hypothetical protein
LFNRGDPDLHARALAALRSEVDAAFSAAVERTPSAQPDSGAPHLLIY